MKPLWDDTDLATERKYLELNAALPEWKHFEAVRDMIQTVTDMQWAEICRAYPDSTEHERRMRLASMWIDRELMKAAFGWDQTDKK